MKPRFTKALLTFTIPLFLTGFLSHSNAATEAPRIWPTAPIYSSALKTITR